MSRLVYLPAAIALAVRLRAGDAAGPWLGYTASPGLAGQLAEDGSVLGDDELQYAALDAAGVAHLVDPRAGGPRLVLAAEIDDAQLSDLDSAEPGAVTAATVSWRQVTALFADEADAVEAVSRARSAVRGRSVVDALAQAEVSALRDRHDLLWYAPDELDQLR